jgi:hypothetical protein
LGISATTVAGTLCYVVTFDKVIEVATFFSGVLMLLVVFLLGLPVARVALKIDQWPVD